MTGRLISDKLYAGLQAISGFGFASTLSREIAYGFAGRSLGCKIRGSFSQQPPQMHR